MGNVKRIERIFGAKIVLVTDSLINFVDKCGIRRFAYYSDCGDQSPKALFEKAIRKNIPVNMLVERVQKGNLYDYIKEVELAE